MSNGKTFLDRIDLGNNYDPRVTATPAPKGTLFRFVPPIGDPVYLIKADDGLSTNWIAFNGSASGNWSVTGNIGGGHVLGTLTPDDWKFISSGFTRGGFKATGEFFLKSHFNYSGSESNFLTGAATTVGAGAATMFDFTVPDQFTGQLDVKIQGRDSTGADNAAFVRAVKFYRQGGGAIISSKVHTLLTDKSQSTYDVQIVSSGNDVQINVIGKILQVVYWTGLLNYQMVGTA